MDLDTIDIRLLDQLQRDASLNNQELAACVHVSPATALRRTRRLVDEGLIERTVALLSADKLAPGLSAIVEVTLEPQTSETLDAFEARATRDEAVQQCYRTASGPDFVLFATGRRHAVVARVPRPADDRRVARSQRQELLRGEAGEVRAGDPASRTHLAHRHATPFASSGSASISAAGTDARVHQQGSGDPAAIAHALESPQRGQRAGSKLMASAFSPAASIRAPSSASRARRSVRRPARPWSRRCRPRSSRPRRPRSARRARRSSRPTHRRR